MPKKNWKYTELQIPIQKNIKINYHGKWNPINNNSQRYNPTCNSSTTLKSDKIGGFLLRTLLRTERMTSIILGSSKHLSNNLLAWHILRNILFTYFRSKHLMMRTQFFFWAFLVFINISIGRISLGVLCSCCSPFKIQQCHHSPHFFFRGVSVHSYYIPIFSAVFRQ